MFVQLFASLISPLFVPLFASLVVSLFATLFAFCLLLYISGHLQLEDKEFEEKKFSAPLVPATVLFGHLYLEDEEFKEKKPPEALVLSIVLGVPELASTNANRDIVCTEIFARLFVSINGQNRK